MWLTQLLALAGLKPGDIDATIIANVVPEASFNLLQLCRRYLNSEPLGIGASGQPVYLRDDVAQAPAPAPPRTSPD